MALIVASLVFLTLVAGLGFLGRVVLGALIGAVLIAVPIFLAW